MTEYQNMPSEELTREFGQVKAEYERLCGLGLSLNMARGKPGAQNLDVSEALCGLVNGETGFRSADGTDCRNYGGLDGLAEMKSLFGEVLGLPAEQVIVGGNSSLSMMFDTVAQAMTHGMGGDPWLLCPDRKFLCPVPGYDRHFAITQYFGFELIPVPMNDEGPDMDVVEKLVEDPSVKGIWCVPKYSNPEGITYSDRTVRRMAALRPAAKDFRIFWDNAYAIHDLYDEGDVLLNLYDECVKAGNPDLPILFTSTSKITFPGAGVAAQGASSANIALLKGRMKYQTIGPDKLNQLRHARMFRSMEELTAQMKKHAEILRPKFDCVLAELDRQLCGTGIARWTKPRGGYFISLYVPDGCAGRVVELCRNAGMVLTPAGATYPYGNDPKDANIRIAPSFPSVEELEKAAAVLCIAVRYAALEKILQ